MVTFAKILTFHLPSDEVASLLEILDARLTPRSEQHHGFRGLLCLEMSEGPNRSQVFVVSKWDHANLVEAEEIAARWWDEASEVLGVGIARSTCEVLRDIPGYHP